MRSCMSSGVMAGCPNICDCNERIESRIARAVCMFVRHKLVRGRRQDGCSVYVMRARYSSTGIHGTAVRAYSSHTMPFSTQSSPLQTLWESNALCQSCPPPTSTGLRSVWILRVAWVYRERYIRISDRIDHSSFSRIIDAPVSSASGLSLCAVVCTRTGRFAVPDMRERC